jgi:hypothetical protein
MEVVPDRSPATPPEQAASFVVRFSVGRCVPGQTCPGACPIRGIEDGCVRDVVERDGPAVHELGLEPGDRVWVEVQQTSGNLGAYGLTLLSRCDETSCGENERCALGEDGLPSCTCKAGFSPDTDGACVPVSECGTCDVTGGECVVDASGRTSCVCRQGFRGEDCSGVCDASESSCTDGVDEDCDGLTDCADPDCVGDVACSSGGAGGAGGQGSGGAGGAL